MGIMSLPTRFLVTEFVPSPLPGSLRGQFLFLFQRSVSVSNLKPPAKRTTYFIESGVGKTKKLLMTRMFLLNKIKLQV